MAFQHEKCSAWGHWWKDVLSMALEIYLEVEAHRATCQPPPLPLISEVVDTPFGWQLSDDLCQVSNTDQEAFCISYSALQYV